MHIILMSIATIMTYALLLIAMLAGLMRQRQARSFGIWNMLHQQVRHSHTADSWRLTNISNHLGMDMVCIGSGGRGASPCKYGLTEIASRRSSIKDSSHFEH
jgi:hypothetical protein